MSGMVMRNDHGGVAVEVGGEEGYAVRNARKKELVEVPWKGAPTMAHLFEQSCGKHHNNPFLGTRKLLQKEFVPSSDGRRFEKVHLGDYEWKTYGEVFACVCNFASGIMKLGHSVDSRVAIFSDTRAEWLIALQVNSFISFNHSIFFWFNCSAFTHFNENLAKLQGCFRQNVTVVTIYATLGEDALVHSLNEVRSYYILKITNFFNQRLVSKVSLKQRDSNKVDILYSSSIICLVPKKKHTSIKGD